MWNYFNFTEKDEKRVQVTVILTIIFYLCLGPVGAIVGAALGASGQFSTRNYYYIKGQIKYKLASKGISCDKLRDLKNKFSK